MSFLAPPRLAFAGRFLSDVSTINNANQGGDPGWNPQGGGAFEFLDCRVSGGEATGGLDAGDPALRFAIAGRPDASSAKMVDLDPDWQMASELWGLSVRVFDPTSGELAFIGRYAVASFRDIWMRQCPEFTQKRGLPNGQPMGARFVSTLSDVEWGPATDWSGLLSELRRASPSRLSIGFHQFGYFYTTDHPRYRTGTLVGCIGPHLDGEGTTVLAARRLQAVPLNQQLPCMGPVDFQVLPDGAALAMDLGHALPIADVDGTIQDLGAWQALPQLRGCEALVVGLAQSDFTPWKTPTNPVTALGEVAPFRPGWYAASGGIATVPLPAEHRAAIAQPLALYARLADGGLVTITREVTDGLLVRADSFVFRMEPGTEAAAVLHVTRFGTPAQGVTVHLSPQTPLQPPALEFPDSVVTDVAGRASDPGTARQSPNQGQPTPDGQVYVLAYSPRLPGSGGASREGTGLTTLDVLAVHVRQKVVLPGAPTWEDDVQPILAGYAALYPIMSRHLFDLADYDAVVGHRVMLRAAFSRHIGDPNHMPVTRDLSASKRNIILAWLEDETGDPTAPLRRRPGAQPAGPAPQSTTARTPGPEAPDAKRDNVGAFANPIAPAAGGVHE